MNASGWSNIIMWPASGMVMTSTPAARRPSASRSSSPRSPTTNVRGIRIEVNISRMVGREPETSPTALRCTASALAIRSVAPSPGTSQTGPRSHSPGSRPRIGRRCAGSPWRPTMIEVAGRGSPPRPRADPRGRDFAPPPRSRHRRRGCGRRGRPPRRPPRGRPRRLRGHGRRACSPSPSVDR